MGMSSKYPPAPRTCKRCEKSFVPVWRGPTFYCSEACRKAGPPLVKMEPFERVYRLRECETCRLIFQPTNARQIYCTHACRMTSNYSQDAESVRRKELSRVMAKHGLKAKAS
jgi:hypothetical protein